MSWRTFKFFELEELKDPDTNQPYDKLKVRAELSKKCSFRVDLMSYKHTKFHRNLFFHFRRLESLAPAVAEGR